MRYQPSPIEDWTWKTLDSIKQQMNINWKKPLIEEKLIATLRQRILEEYLQKHHGLANDTEIEIKRTIEQWIATIQAEPFMVSADSVEF